MDEILKLATMNWTNLMSILTTLREDQVKALLEYECAQDKPRIKFVERIHQRYSALSSARERAELIATAKGKLL